ncbi:MAG: FAD-dependent oxidoreductase [Nitrospinae bacterium]|nr:FAD-dependent oxidoreductase [Nitrospinota bacterium]
MRDVIIIGGGIMGLLTARELRKAGRNVTIIEKGRPGAGTTWASAGIISAHGTSGSADIAGLPGLRLRAASDEDWAHLAEALAEESGTDIEYRLTGVLLIALDEEEAESIQQKARAREWGDTEWMPPDVLRSEEPCLSTDLLGALHVTGGNLEVRKLGPALEIACRRQGVEILTGCAVEEILSDGARVTGVRTDAGVHEAPAVFVCAGIGSRSVPGAVPRPPITPQRGQMLALDARALGLKRVVLTVNDPYLVPRADGRVILGATREFAGEDPRLTVGGLTWLLNEGTRIAPGIAACAIEETWSGFRPTSSDYLPLIGLGALEGLYFCTGHGPSGIGPAPASVRLATALYLGDAPPLDPAPYDPMRFA